MAKTKVVFIKDAPPHGRASDVKNVAGGFFRNALMPQGFAVLANPHRIHEAEVIRARRQEAAHLGRERMEAYAKELDGVALEFVKKANEQGGLFDALDKREILEALHKKGFGAIEEKHLDVERPFDKIGEYTVALSLGENLPAFLVKVIITKEE